MIDNEKVAQDILDKIQWAGAIRDAQELQDIIVSIVDPIVDDANGMEKQRNFYELTNGLRADEVKKLRKKLKKLKEQLDVQAAELSYYKQVNRLHLTQLRAINSDDFARLILLKLTGRSETSEQ